MSIIPEPINARFRISKARVRVRVFQIFKTSLTVRARVRVTSFDGDWCKNISSLSVNKKVIIYLVKYIYIRKMVVKTELCAFSEYRIYPGHGIKFIKVINIVIVIDIVDMMILLI